MPGYGKKRTRKDEEENAPKKKPKARDERPKSPKRAAAAAVGTPVLAAFPAASDTMSKPAPPKPAPAPRVPSKKLPGEDALGNPYENLSATPHIAKKKQDEPPKHTAAEPVVTASDTESIPMSGKSVDSVNIGVPLIKKSRNPTSIPCILLVLVAILMWCTVTLLGLLLSERMDHELQIFTLRDMLHNSESVEVPPPPKVEELEKNVRFWKGRAQQLESQKKGMLQEFGEKIASLEYME